MSGEERGKPILCVDFDGVIHSYSSGWKGADIVADPPVKGALEWLFQASHWWDVQIYSSRTKEKGGIEAMKAWLEFHASRTFEEAAIAGDFMTRISFPAQKPAANLTIDDRAICFQGNWNDPSLNPQYLLKFRPWNKR